MTNFLKHHISCCLMGWRNGDFANLYMRRRGGGIEDDVGNIVAGKRFNTLINTVGAFRISVKSHDAEVGFGHAGLNIGNTNGRFD